MEKVRDIIGENFRLASGEEPYYAYNSVDFKMAVTRLMETRIREEADTEHGAKVELGLFRAVMADGCWWGKVTANRYLGIPRRQDPTYVKGYQTLYDVVPKPGSVALGSPQELLANSPKIAGMFGVKLAKGGTGSAKGPARETKVKGASAGKSRAPGVRGGTKAIAQMLKAEPTAPDTVDGHAKQSGEEGRGRPGGSDHDGTVKGGEGAQGADNTSPPPASEGRRRALGGSCRRIATGEKEGPKTSASGGKKGKPQKSTLKVKEQKPGKKAARVRGAVNGITGLHSNSKSERDESRGDAREEGVEAGSNEAMSEHNEQMEREGGGKDAEDNSHPTVYSRRQGARQGLPSKGPTSENTEQTKKASDEGALKKPPE
jgi:hypothetical protein